MSTLSRVLTATSVAALIALNTGTASATMKYRNLKIDPFLGVTSVYDSNIYLKNVNEKSSIITTFSPGVSFQLPVREHQFSLRYQADVISYTENPSLNNAIHNSVDAAAALKFPVGLNLTVKDAYRSTTDPASAEQTERVKRNQNTVAATLGYTISRYFTVSVTGSQLLHDYIQDSSLYALSLKQQLSRRENEGNLEIGYNYSPKLSLLLDYAYGTVDYTYPPSTTGDRSSIYNQVRAGIRGKLTPKTTGEAKAGAKARKYNSSALESKDTTTSVVSLGTVTDFSERTQLSLGVSRNLEESTFETNPYYTANVLTFGLTQKLMRNWKGTLTGLFEFDGYPEISSSINDKREDSNLQGGLGLSYSAFEWLTVGGGYTVRDRNSNINSNDYTDHLVSVSAKLVFYRFSRELLPFSGTGAAPPFSRMIKYNAIIFPFVSFFLCFLLNCLQHAVR